MQIGEDCGREAQSSDSVSQLKVVTHRREIGFAARPITSEFGSNY